VEERRDSQQQQRKGKAAVISGKKKKEGRGEGLYRPRGRGNRLRLLPEKGREGVSRVLPKGKGVRRSLKSSRLGRPISWKKEDEKEKKASCPPGRRGGRRPKGEGTTILPFEKKGRKETTIFRGRRKRIQKKIGKKKFYRKKKREDLLNSSGKKKAGRDAPPAKLQGGKTKTATLIYDSKVEELAARLPIKEKQREDGGSELLYRIKRGWRRKEKRTPRNYREKKKTASSFSAGCKGEKRENCRSLAHPSVQGRKGKKKPSDP